MEIVLDIVNNEQNALLSIGHDDIPDGANTAKLTQAYKEIVKCRAHSDYALSPLIIVLLLPQGIFTNWRSWTETKRINREIKEIISAERSTSNVNITWIDTSAIGWADYFQTNEKCLNKVGAKKLVSMLYSSTKHLW